MGAHERPLATWGEFADADPELAAFGAERLQGRVAYLATIRASGSPRLHPVTPILAGRSLFVFVNASSPKVRDLRRNPRYALHCSVSDTSGSGGEFSVVGRGCLVTDPEARHKAANATEFADGGFVLFELHVEEARSVTYRWGLAERRRWAPVG